jgi:hypothetical protein
MAGAAITGVIILRNNFALMLLNKVYWRDPKFQYKDELLHFQ